MASGRSHFLKSAPAAKTGGLVMLSSILINATAEMIALLDEFSVDTVPKGL